MRYTDPARMSRDDILAELGELLAAGVQRHLANRIKAPLGSDMPEEALDRGRDPEAQCGASGGTAT